MRESDRVAICGDVLRNPSFFALRSGLREPPMISAENRRSIRKPAALEPKINLPGHGPAMVDIASFKRFVANLAA